MSGYHWDPSRTPAEEAEARRSADSGGQTAVDVRRGRGRSDLWVGVAAIVAVTALVVWGLGQFFSSDASAPVDSTRPVASARDEAATISSEEIRSRFVDSYGWPADAFQSIESIEFEGVDSLLVVSNLYDKAENRSEADKLCMAVNSVARTPDDWRITRVSAGEGGRYLAECDVLPGLR